jgi:hypothetical protein
MSFSHAETRDRVEWITQVDSKRLWGDFLEKLDLYQRKHAIRATKNCASPASPVGELQ